MKKLVIATHNEGKVREFAELLAPLRIPVISASSLGLPEPEETGVTFEENAIIKAKSAAEHSGEYALADDSGLCVASLDGAPGVYSAGWAGPGKDFTRAFGRIASELDAKNIPSQGAVASFTCVLALIAPGGGTNIFEGQAQGALTFPPRGDSGFGYDAIFVPAGHARTFAQMRPEEKHALSHRAKACALFLSYAASYLAKEMS